jgi:hypothetical protein
MEQEYVFATEVSASATMQVTTKIPPSFNGTSMTWFAYEEAIDDWCDITELDPNKRAPALKNKLAGAAAQFKHLLDRDRLKDAENGVEYFKRILRPYFVKGAHSVYLWRFFQLHRLHRGNQEMVQWIGRFSVSRKRLSEAWMDLFEPVDAENGEFRETLAERNRELRRNGQPAIALDDGLAFWNMRMKEQHQERFPISDNFTAQLFIVLADLNEQQRERLTSTLALRNLKLQNYTWLEVRNSFMELFCAPRSSLENPNIR